MKKTTILQYGVVFAIFMNFVLLSVLGVLVINKLNLLQENFSSDISYVGTKVYNDRESIRDQINEVIYRLEQGHIVDPQPVTGHVFSTNGCAHVDVSQIAHGDWLTKIVEPQLSESLEKQGWEIYNYTISEGYTFSYINAVIQSYGISGDCIYDVNNMGYDWYYKLDDAIRVGESSIKQGRWCDFVGCPDGGE